MAPTRNAPLVFLLLVASASAVIAGDSATINHYSLDAVLLEDGIQATLEVRVRNTGDQPLPQLALDANSESVAIESASVEWSHHNNRLLLSLDPPIASGETLEIEIGYRATRSTGLVVSEGEAFTAFHTSQWMPCRVSPAARATFSLELNVPLRYEVAAPGSLVRLGTADGRTRWRAELDRPYPAYVLGFAAGDWQSRELTDEDGVVFRVLAPRGPAPEALDRVLVHLICAKSWFETVAGTDYPGAGYTQVFVSRAAQELVDMSVVSVAHLEAFIADPQEDWLLIHELAHQWWGNSVTCRDWSHFWLNEGITTFMVAAFKEEQWGRDAYEREMVLARGRYAWVRDEGLEQSMISHEWPTLRASRAVNYSKGALVLHLLRQELGDESFWEGLAIFTARGLGSAVVSRDLESAMTAAVTDSAGTREIFATWVHGVGVPRLRLDHQVGDGMFRLRIEQSAGWRVVAEVAWTDSSGRKSREVEIDSRERKARLELELPFEGELRSVRFDARGQLPFVADHPRSPEMLLLQAVQEPDVFGRMDAFERLSSICAAGAEDPCGDLDVDLAAIEDQLVRDSPAAYPD